MTDWAAQTAQQTLEQRRVANQKIERSNRIAQIKTEAGLRLFKQLADWLNKEVTEYNAKLAQGSDADDQLTVTVTQGQPAYASQAPDDLIVINRRDGRKNSLKIKYSAVLGTLSYECGGQSAKFTLCVGDNDQAFFETEYHESKSIEDIGIEALTKFLQAKS